MPKAKEQERERESERERRRVREKSVLRVLQAYIVGNKRLLTNCIILYKQNLAL